MSVAATLTIRPARPEDDAVIGEILVNAFVQGYAQKMPEVIVTEERKADLRNVAEKRKAGAVIVAELDGRVVGACTIYPPGSPKSQAWMPMAADLRMVGIDLEFRGQRISDRLLDGAEDQAREWGCDTLNLHVRRGAHGVVGMYVKRGFQRDPGGDLDKLPTIYLEAFFKKL
jgi:ribosomal protein S18 acetylase RimI-like enzyme